MQICWLCLIKRFLAFGAYTLLASNLWRYWALVMVGMWLGTNKEAVNAGRGRDRCGIPITTCPAILWTFLEKIDTSTTWTKHKEKSKTQVGIYAELLEQSMNLNLEFESKNRKLAYKSPTQVQAKNWKETFGKPLLLNHCQILKHSQLPDHFEKTSGQMASSASMLKTYAEMYLIGSYQKNLARQAEYHHWMPCKVCKSPWLTLANGHLPAKILPPISSVNASIWPEGETALSRECKGLACGGCEAACVKGKKFWGRYLRSRGSEELLLITWLDPPAKAVMWGTTLNIVSTLRIMTDRQTDLAIDHFHAGIFCHYSMALKTVIYHNSYFIHGRLM